MPADPGPDEGSLPGLSSCCVFMWPEGEARVEGWREEEGSHSQ